MYLRKTCRVFSIIILSLTVLLTTGLANQQHEDGSFYLEGMGGELLLGQGAKNAWGDFWSAPTVTAINLGYLAANGYPAFVPDTNGNGRVDRPDLIHVADLLGNNEYMKTVTTTGTTDPDLLYGLAKYVDLKYPGEFEIKVYEQGFSGEYAEERGGLLPDKLFSLPIRLYPDPLFADYRKELRGGEMVWLGLSQKRSQLNHFLAGRSFDPKENTPGRFMVDLVEPRAGQQVRPARARVIETIMRERGEIRYGGRFIPVDIMLALSPIEKDAGPCLPDLVCTVDCETQEERVCVEEGTGDCERVCVEEGTGDCERVCVEEECRGWCTEDGERYCCEGYECIEWETVCEEGECLEWETVCEEGGECLEWETRQTHVCRVVTKNQGCSTAGWSTGTLTLKSKGQESLNPFLNTEIRPGEEQVFLLNPKLFRYETAICSVDINDDVEESDEENNESTQ
ncbi:hypothetical protein KGY58_02080 [Candidatus Bipolaricaulota bacterium]|nr:hypothetical protein [Candidatus Bipolaricaulota bacterium]